MEEGIEKVPALRITEQERTDIEDTVVREFPLTIIFNNQELVTLLCSPSNLKQLAVGYLVSEGLIKEIDEINRVTLDNRRGVVRVNTKSDEEIPKEFLSKRLITSGCGMGSTFYAAADAQSATRVQSEKTLPANAVFALMKEFQHRSEVFRATGGVHSAALCDGDSIVLFSEDIGRHNAIDKIFGECLLNNIPTDDKIILTSGRISSEILLKVLKRNIPILLSKSAPTASGVRLAIDSGITLVGFVRGNRMNVYANAWRVT
jgi:FdhD protein